MTHTKEKISEKIKELESKMLSPDFWQDKNLAQKFIQELQDLKDELAGFGKYDRGNAVITIYSGAGGDDAEDWSRMLFEMYSGFAVKKNWGINILYLNRNDQNGFRTITFEIIGKGVYGFLKNESGTHRLVRISPFNANDKRQTSFSMVEVLPEFTDQKAVVLLDDELEIENTKSSGPGGQNVNKRETAVRIKHKPTGLSAFVSTERSQVQNREKAMDILRAKIFTLRETEKKKQEADMSVSKNSNADWGSQIRSYVLHPYKMVKDHRTGVESSKIDDILKGEIETFLKPMSL
jgi:peptide chain release factor 2